MAAPPGQTAGKATSVQRRGWCGGRSVGVGRVGGVVRRFRVVSCPPGRGLRWPALHVLRIRHPELAGLVMRNEERAGLLVVYRHDRSTGFVILSVYPRWRWVPQVIFRYWSEWPSLFATARLVLAFAGCWLVGWWLFGVGP